MKKQTLDFLVKVIAKSFPKEQAKREASWIYNELPANQWVAACESRSKHVPLQYILGNQPFGNLTLNCKPGVLIPRLDTEEWVLEAAELLKNTKIGSIVDYCTGSGCIGLGFASELNNAKLVSCIDFKDDAVELATENCNQNATLLKSKIEVHKGDVFNGYLPSNFDYRNNNGDCLLLANPPYIPIKDLVDTEVEKSVLEYEPREALLGELEFYDALCTQILVPNNAFKSFIFELGYLAQAKRVRESLSPSWIVGMRSDHSGNLRNVLGWQRDTKFQILEEMVDDYL